ncbi:hypothetical protein SynA1544_02365 [Synechococcus sp. A15-44]|nr:hypothetical protein SynA1544_02365 [Synechococcus sp. A15-44]
MRQRPSFSVPRLRRGLQRPAGHSGVNLVVLLINFQCCRLISLPGVNPLRRSHSDRFLVHLNC